MSKNDNLHNSKRKKNDEFYTLYEDIESELSNYNCFLNKTVYLNCDNPNTSQFYRYFYNNFNNLKLKKIIATYYSDTENSIKTTYNGKEELRSILKQNGDFRSQECVDILKECDIVVSNPPFSLFREYIGLLLSNNKDFIIIGNSNSALCKDIFPFIKEQKLYLGKNKVKNFLVPDDYDADNVTEQCGRKVASFGNVC